MQVIPFRYRIVSAFFLRRQNSHDCPNDDGLGHVDFGRPLVLPSRSNTVADVISVSNPKGGGRPKVVLVVNLDDIQPNIRAKILSAITVATIHRDSPQRSQVVHSNRERGAWQPPPPPPDEPQYVTEPVRTSPSCL